MKAKILPCGCHKINDAGRVFSKLYQFSRRGVVGIQTRKGSTWKELEPTTTATGYKQVAIHGRSIRLNRLVASNFIPNPLSYPEAQHKDGNKSDNRASNLKWGNQRHNAADRELHGHTRHGTKLHNAKLCDKSVKEIRVSRAAGESLLSLAKRFGVSKKLILLVVQGKIWRHVQ